MSPVAINSLTETVLGRVPAESVHTEALGCTKSHLETAMFYKAAKMLQVTRRGCIGHGPWAQTFGLIRPGGRRSGQRGVELCASPRGF